MSAFHPDPMTLMNYVAGNLSSAQALAIRVHLGYCHQCRSQARQLAQVGGAMLEKMTPSSCEAGDFDALMAKLDSEPPEPRANSASNTTTATAAATARAAAEEANPLLRYLPSSLSDLPWQRQTRDIFKFDLTPLLDCPGFQVALQKIRAGAAVPNHTHKGMEYTLVLQGGFSDELGVYHEGDFIARDGHHQHSPTALQNEDCICLTVLSAPLKFTGWQRIFNPFMAWSWR